MDDEETLKLVAGKLKKRPELITWNVGYVIFLGFQLFLGFQQNATDEGLPRINYNVYSL
mgnify:CR=1 FL=1